MAAMDSRWSRSRYPIGSTIKGNAQSSPAARPREVDDDAHEHPPKYSDESSNAVPWYHAVTDLREKPILQPGVFDSLSSRLEDAEILNSDGSLTAVSMSQRSLSPPFSDRDMKPRPINTIDVDYSTHAHGKLSTSMDFTNTSQESLGEESRHSSSTSRPSSAGSEDYLQEPDSSGKPVTRKRTLRRTPRNRRIVAPIPASEVGLPPYSARKAADTDESFAPPSGPWKRLNYPLRAPTDADVTESAHADDSANNDNNEEVQANLRTQTSSRAKENSDILSSRSEDAPHPSSEETKGPSPTLLAVDLSSVREQSGSSQSTKQIVAHPIGNFRHKRGYPLQSPVSHVDLRSSLSPPPSPHETLPQFTEADIEHIAEEPSISQGRIYRRQGYPLQVPRVSHEIPVNLSPPPTPDITPSNVLPGPQGIQSAVTKGDGKPWGMAELGSPKSALVANVIGTLKYPSQLPAKIAEFEEIEVKKPASLEKSAGTPQHLSETPVNKVTKSLKRKVYPLQSPASIVDLRPFSEQPFSVNEAPQISQNVEVKADSDRRPSNQVLPVAPRRSRYPLQDKIDESSLGKLPDAVSEVASPTGTQAKVDDISYAQDEPLQRSYRRQRYPLNSSSSVRSTDAVSLNPPNSLPQKSERRTEESQEANKPSSTAEMLTSTKIENQDVPGLTQNSIKSAHPLQVSMPAPPQSSGLPTISVTPGSPGKENPPNDRGRETEIAKKVVNQWRRQVYPVQSPDKASPFARSPTPQPSMESFREKKHEKIHLPINLRAVKNSDDPPSRGRTLVVCLDGTGDKFDNDNSNIVHIVSALKKDDPNQVTYYQAGIGTYGEGGLSGGVTAAMDMAVGAGLGLHVRDAYHFLMHTYKEGDKICIFGFSRGAYTARCVAGMIHKVGLLPPRNIQQIPFAYEFYSNDTAEGWKQSRDFKKTFSINVNVHFLGCFDSVASVGFIPRTLPLSTTPTNKPRYFRHAMALDERRAKFKVARHRKVKVGNTQENRSRTSAIAHFLHTWMPGYRDQNDTPPAYTKHPRYGHAHHPNITDAEYERLMASDENFETDVLEVWFAGAHADVGGGAVPNDDRHKLAQIPLRWMIRQAFECDTGILFHTKFLAEFGLDVHTLWPQYRRLVAPAHGPPPSVVEKYASELPPREVRRSKLVSVFDEEHEEDVYRLEHPTDEDWTPEQIEDYYDSLSPMNDQLIQAPNWWILELWPVQIKIPRAPGEVDIIVSMNMGRYRAAEEAEPLLHWTVRHRMAESNYKLGVRTAPQVTWKTVV